MLRRLLSNKGRSNRQEFWLFYFAPSLVFTYATTYIGSALVD